MGKVGYSGIKINQLVQTVCKIWYVWRGSKQTSFCQNVLWDLKPLKIPTWEPVLCYHVARNDFRGDVLLTMQISPKIPPLRQWHEGRGGRAPGSSRVPGR